MTQAETEAAQTSYQLAVKHLNQVTAEWDAARFRVKELLKEVAQLKSAIGWRDHPYATGQLS